MPEIRLPDIKLPDVRFRDGKLRDVTLPDIDLRDRLPDVDFSHLSLPGPLRDLSLPEVSVPEVSLPAIHLPDVKLPEVPRPRLDVTMPSVDLRQLDPRHIDLSGFDTKRLRSLAPAMKAARRPASRLPWILVAGVAGLFAGWWLATSSQTGPTVRRLADRVRSRVDAWRAARADWDDADTEERAEGFWSNEQGWRQTGSQPGAVSGERSWESGPADDAGSTDWEGAASAAAAGGSAEEAAGGAGYEPSSGETTQASGREG